MMFDESGCASECPTCLKDYYTDHFGCTPGIFLFDTICFNFEPVVLIPAVEMSLGTRTGLHIVGQNTK